MTDDIEYRLADHETLEAASPALIEAARQEALDFLDNMDGDEHYRSGFVEACIMMDRILTDPEYFGLRDD